MRLRELSNNLSERLEAIERDLSIQKNTASAMKMEQTMTNTILHSIYTILKGASQEGKAEEIPVEGLWQGRWVSGGETAKILGWKSVSARALKKAGVKYEQPGGGNAGLLVERDSLEKYIARKRNNKKK